jgi:hypothetical protein
MKLYMIPEVVASASISFISVKQCRKFISQTGKFLFFVIHAQSEQKIVATFRASMTGLSMQQKQVDKVVEEYKDIISSPTGVPLHFQVKHSINMTPDTPLPNGLVYHLSLSENEEIKHHIQYLLQRGTFAQDHDLLEAQSCLCRRKTDPCESALIARP